LQLAFRYDQFVQCQIERHALTVLTGGSCLRRFFLRFAFSVYRREHPFDIPLASPVPVEAYHRIFQLDQIDGQISGKDIALVDFDIQFRYFQQIGTIQVSQLQCIEINPAFHEKTHFPFFGLDEADLKIGGQLAVLQFETGFERQITYV